MATATKKNVRAFVRACARLVSVLRTLCCIHGHVQRLSSWTDQNPLFHDLRGPFVGCGQVPDNVRFARSSYIVFFGWDLHIYGTFVSCARVLPIGVCVFSALAPCVITGKRAHDLDRDRDRDFDRDDISDV